MISIVRHWDRPHAPALSPTDISLRVSTPAESIFDLSLLVLRSRLHLIIVSGLLTYSILKLGRGATTTAANLLGTEARRWSSPGPSPR